MIALKIASVIVGAGSYGANFFAAVLILTLPSIAIAVLLERMLFTDEERLEIKNRYQRRFTVET